MPTSYDFAILVRNTTTAAEPTQHVVAADAAGAVQAWLALNETDSEILRVIRGSVVAGIDSDVAATVGDFLADGSVPATGDFDMGGNAIKNALDPVDPQDLVTKAYADWGVSVTGVPVDGSHPDGTYAFRSDGSGSDHIYFATGGAWVALV